MCAYVCACVCPCMCTYVSEAHGQMRTWWFLRVNSLLFCLITLPHLRLPLCHQMEWAREREVKKRGRGERKRCEKDEEFPWTAAADLLMCKAADEPPHHGVTLKPLRPRGSRFVHMPSLITSSCPLFQQWLKSLRLAPPLLLLSRFLSDTVAAANSTGSRGYVCCIMCRYDCAEERVKLLSTLVCFFFKIYYWVH